MSGKVARHTLWGIGRWRFVSGVGLRRFAATTEKVGGIDRAITMGRASIDARLVDKTVAQAAAAASKLVASREPAKMTRRFVMLPRTALIMSCRS